MNSPTSKKTYDKGLKVNRFKFFPICLFFFSLCFYACGPDAVLLRGHLNSPEVHTDNGRKLLKAGKPQAALREFEMAVELSPNHSPAYDGIAKIYLRKGEFHKSLIAVKNSRTFAKTEEEMLSAEVNYLRLYAYGNRNLSNNWLSSAESVFQKAIKNRENEPSLYFYMGLVYKQAKQYKKAERHFLKVMELDRGYILEADKAYGDILNLP